MADKFERYIRDHRPEFDTEEPGEKVWEKIKPQLQETPVISIGNYSWAWKAAAILLFGLSTYLLVERNLTPAIVEVAQQENALEFSLSEIEMHYTSIIEQKKVEIVNLGAQHPDLIKDFQKDVGTLDTLYSELQLEFGETNNERVLDAMINNLKLRIDILNYQLATIEKIQKREEKRHGQNDDTYSI